MCLTSDFHHSWNHHAYKVDALWHSYSPHLGMQLYLSLWINKQLSLARAPSQQLYMYFLTGICQHKAYSSPSNIDPPHFVAYDHKTCLVGTIFWRWSFPHSIIPKLTFNSYWRFSIGCESGLLGGVFTQQLLKKSFAQTGCVFGVIMSHKVMSTWIYTINKKSVQDVMHP